MTSTLQAAAASAVTEASQEIVTSTLQDITMYFLRLGTLGFGGPVALAGYMQRDLVERRVPAPYFRRFAKNPSLKAFVDGVYRCGHGSHRRCGVRPRQAGDGGRRDRTHRPRDVRDHDPDQERFRSLS